MNSRHTWTILLAASLTACQSPSSSDGLETVTDELKVGTALFVVGDAALTAPGDVALKKRLEGLALAVTVKAAKDVTTADATGKRVVVVSATVASGDVNTKFTGVKVPLVTAESAILDDLRMTGAVSGADFGVAKTQTKVALAVGSSDPMAAGLSGTQTVTSSATDLSWGKPATGAVKVARLPSDSTRLVSFRYERDAQMVGIKAPERRVALFLTDGTASILTSAGKALTDAAIRWAARLPTKKGLGIDCAASSECASGVCADGVCCGSTCGQLCKSCNLPGQEGTCTNVPNGLDPKRQCGPAARCSGSTLITASLCNGAGACTGPGMVDCSPSMCQTDRCLERCTSDAECTVNAYCNGVGSCRFKEKAGVSCSRDPECESRLCGGRCCPAGTPCTCTQPNPTNLLSAAGFDTSLPGWITEAGVRASVSWSPDDWQACPFSGSMRFQMDVSDAAASQCVRTTQESLQWGGRVKASLPAVDWTGRCMLTSFASGDCSGPPLVQETFTLNPILQQANTWGSFAMGFSGAAGTNSVALRCDAIDDSGVGLQVWFDSMFISSPGYFF